MKYKFIARLLLVSRPKRRIITVNTVRLILMQTKVVEHASSIV